jgi:N-acetylmuramoyl-L-alanine amidase
MMGRMRWGILRLAMAAAVAPAGAHAVVLDRVLLHAGGEPSLELFLSGPVVPWVRTLAATPDAPHRIYVDLADTTLGASVPKVLPSEIPGIERVRAGQFTSTTARVVLDTTRAQPFDVTTTDRRVTITFAAADPSSSPAPSPAAAAPVAPASPPPPDPAEPQQAHGSPDPASPPPALEPPAASANPATQAGQPPALTEPASLLSGSDSDLPLVVVDAGHGGHDPGAEGVGGILEKTVALQIAHRLAAKLPARLPVDSLLTRSDDSFVPLTARLPHRDSDNVVFLSLHANACDDPRPSGLEIFFGDRGGREDELLAKQLARLVTRELRARLLRVRGRPRPGPFSVLVRNDAPSILVELGYLTHPEDAARLQDPRYQELLTDALVDAVAAFLQSGRGKTIDVHHRQDLVPSGTPSRRVSRSGASGKS